MATTSNSTGITTSLPLSDKPGMSVSFPFGKDAPPTTAPLVQLQAWKDKGYTVEICSFNHGWAIKVTTSFVLVPASMDGPRLDYRSAVYPRIDDAVAAALEVLQP